MGLVEEDNEWEESCSMVIEGKATRFICDLCQKEYSTREAAEKCQEWCQRFVDSPNLTNLKLSPRVFNALYRAKIYTVSDLKKHSEEELLVIEGFGRKSVLEVREKLKQYEEVL
ncbi:hypothetical protein DESME_09620 [Desulfitobacterium metallireducens DSM 15288]|uniref:RNA polymerase alpha subunit C-terminal domain-containing protein n=1 Tax=Desulfitobacterium metallireducens DSM 15288 TaxID=871968 RepID=W0EGG7_9FIRM|nr:hypothetical protein DESME_09620 [Desulfitobacterium metallireducens DSM 15288]